MSACRPEPLLKASFAEEEVECEWNDLIPSQDTQKDCHQIEFPVCVFVMLHLEVQVSKRVVRIYLNALRWVIEWNCSSVEDDANELQKWEGHRAGTWITNTQMNYSSVDITVLHGHMLLASDEDIFNLSTLVSSIFKAFH